jgi:hypothetical protein
MIPPRFFSVGRRGPSRRQGELPFLRRARRLDRAFKAGILASVGLAILAMILGTSTGRHSSARVGFEARKAVAWLLGFEVDRAEFEAQRHRERLRGADLVRGFLGDVADAKGPTMREFLRVARMDRDSAVVRWGNVNWSLALSSAVFEPDDSGRSYRLRPDTRSVWLINLTIDKVSAMFEIPDTPEARRLGEAVGGRVVPESVQSTNSWGCRGPEPDPKAAVRGLVLGDSNMQGLLVGDDQTPPARLEARLRADLGASVSVLNTGHLGYSPEQYYYTLVAYFGRFRPQFVIVSICDNDFGDLRVAANWAEGEYWLDAIAQFCRTRGVYFLAVPVPQEDALLGRRDEGLFPGKVSTILDGSGLNYLNPVEEFATEQLKLRAGAVREGRALAHSPLFNRKYGDNHLSPEGCDLWARIVARRLRLAWAIQNPRGIEAPSPRE